MGVGDAAVQDTAYCEEKACPAGASAAAVLHTASWSGVEGTSTSEQDAVAVDDAADETTAGRGVKDLPHSTWSRRT